MSPNVPETKAVYAASRLGILFEDVPLVEVICFVVTRKPGDSIVCSSGLCCCVPCLTLVAVVQSLLRLTDRRDQNQHSKPKVLSENASLI